MTNFNELMTAYRAMEARAETAEKSLEEAKSQIEDIQKDTDVILTEVKNARNKQASSYRAELRNCAKKIIRLKEDLTSSEKQGSHWLARVNELKRDLLDTQHALRMATKDTVRISLLDQSDRGVIEIDNSLTRITWNRFCGGWGQQHSSAREAIDARLASMPVPMTGRFPENKARLPK